MKTKEKGDLAIAHAISYYMANGYEVCLPIGDKRPYDLVVEISGKLRRVQVKFAGFYHGVKQHKVALRITGGNRSRSTAAKYTETDFDDLFVYTADCRKFLIPWKDITARNELSIEHNKYKIYEIV